MYYRNSYYSYSIPATAWTSNLCSSSEWGTNPINYFSQKAENAIGQPPKLAFPHSPKAHQIRCILVHLQFWSWKALTNSCDKDVRMFIWVQCFWKPFGCLCPTETWKFCAWYVPTRVLFRNEKNGKCRTLLRFLSVMQCVLWNIFVETFQKLWCSLNLVVLHSVFIIPKSFRSTFSYIFIVLGFVCIFGAL